MSDRSATGGLTASQVLSSLGAPRVSFPKASKVSRKVHRQDLRFVHRSEKKNRKSLQNSDVLSHLSSTFKVQFHLIFGHGCQCKWQPWKWCGGIPSLRGAGRSALSVSQLFISLLLRLPSICRDAVAHPQSKKNCERVSVEHNLA